MQKIDLDALSIEELAKLRDDLAAARKARADFEASLPRCLVSVAEEKPRAVRILPRGNFLVETGDIVQPALPAVLKSSWQSLDKPQLTRRDLAEWLIARERGGQRPASGRGEA